nr:putative reverse transcriptase domain-containing protein [Tanacetum cinerariifolium]
MSTKDVKSLALRHGIPLDLHPVALTKGWTMDQLLDDMIGMYEQYFKFSGIKRHHDSDISDSVPEDGFSEQDVQTLAEKVIDLRPVPSRLLFQGRLATTWDVPGFHPVFKDTEGNVSSLSIPIRSYHRKGSAITNQDLRAQHIVPPLLAGQAIPDKTDHQKEVEMTDPKIVATRERNARASAKKREKKKRGPDEGEGSLPHGKRKKTSVARRDSSAASEHVSSLEPIRMAYPAGLNMENPSGGTVNIAESYGDQSLHASHHDSANHSVHEE